LRSEDCQFISANSAVNYPFHCALPKLSPSLHHAIAYAQNYVPYIWG